MRNELKSGIYCIENIINNKKYIGQSVNINQRWSKHICELKNGNHDNDYLQKSWNKYGEEHFKFYILESCEKDLLDERETYYIDFYNTMDRNYGYNLKSGGQASNYVCDEVREKISESNKKSYQKSNLRQIRSLDALNQWANPEIKQKIMGENNGMYGKHHTEEAKRKIGEKRIGKPSSQRNTTPVLCVELNRSFVDAVTACNELGINQSNTGSLLEVCRGKRKTCGGYHWKFLLENNI